MSSERLLRSNTVQSGQQESIYEPDRRQQRDMISNHGLWDVRVCLCVCVCRDLSCKQIWSPEMLP